MNSAQAKTHVRDFAEQGGQTPPKVRIARRTKNLLMLIRQLHVLCSTGTPIVEALEAVECQNRAGPWRDIVADLRRQVVEGASLSEAMNAYTECFDPACRSMVAAGESGGNLADMLQRLSALLRRRLHVRNAVLGALVYPCLLTVIAVVVLTLMLIFVVPSFAKLFGSLDAPLPPATQALISMSDALRSYWWLAIGVVAAAVIATREYLGTSPGRRRLDAAMVRLPIIGRITRSFATTGVIRMLGTLLVSRVPILEALRLTRDNAGNACYADLLAKAEEAVTRGEPISSTFNDPELISMGVCESMRTGEKNGQVGPLLLQMADLLDEENEVILRSLTSIIEPVILIGMGLLVGFVALSMFLPLLDMTALAGEGG